MFDSEFNPKSFNLLDEQLTVSGLEMKAGGVITAAAISAGASLIGGIFGSSAASKANKQAKKDREKQQELANRQAGITNRYNKSAAAAERKDYFAARQFQYEMATKQWQYETDMQDYRYLQDVKAYGASVENYGQQMLYNNISYQAAKDSQMAAFNETLDAATFEKQDMLVESLQSEGAASMGQAGVSRNKTMQAVAAQQGRNLAVLRATLTSSTEELQRSFMDIALQKYGADMQAKANLMIKPDRLPSIMKPQLGPERTFIEPALVLPAAVPPVQRQSTMAPLIGSIANAGSTLALALK